jgi:hypothetical protein
MWRQRALPCLTPRQARDVRTRRFLNDFRFLPSSLPPAVQDQAGGGVGGDVGTVSAGEGARGGCVLLPGARRPEPTVCAAPRCLPRRGSPWRRSSSPRAQSPSRGPPAMWDETERKLGLQGEISRGRRTVAQRDDAVRFGDASSLWPSQVTLRT